MQGAGKEGFLGKECVCEEKALGGGEDESYALREYGQCRLVLLKVKMTK